MNEERWHQIDTILKDALDQQTESRAAFLDQACGTDTSLREEVEKLIAAYEKAGSLLESPISSSFECLSGLPSSLELGPYHLEKLLGTGGMGNVFLAKDRRLDRKVAIKLLRAELTVDDGCVARFAFEARAASALNHPNIVTVYEVGEMEGVRYIVTEYVDGKTLRERINAGPMDLTEALDIAIQVAAALDTAHSAGIIHRDIKADNVMIRPDGYVKVLDFGLAKLMDAPFPAPSEQPPALSHLTTDSGLIMGTPRYMSPEQARGQKVDRRTDIFSLGVLIYEMVAGHAPFVGATRSGIMAAILKDEPPLLTASQPQAPVELERVIEKTLRKNPSERYQTAGDLLKDLKHLKENLTLAQYRSGESGSNLTRDTDSARRQTPEPPPTLPQRSKRWAALALLAVMLLATGFITWFNLSPPPLLKSADTILLADFENKTGEEIFEKTLRSGLAIQLSQSPFLDLLPDLRTQQTLGLMGRSPDEPVVGQVAREVALRENLKAFITGSIARLGNHYVITLEATEVESGTVFAREQVEAESKEQVLAALSQGARRIREKLGESLGSIQKFDKPLEEATTSSLEAFRYYAEGAPLAVSGRLLQAIPFYERAAAIDPEFGYVYSHLAVFYWVTQRPVLAEQYAEKAYGLRDRLTELEKLRLTFRYHLFATGDLNKAIEAAVLLKQMHPRWAVPNDLALAYLISGDFEKVIPNAQESIRMSPDFAGPYANLAQAHLRLNRLSDADDTLAQALARSLDMTRFRSMLYEIAFIRSDTATMQKQIDAMRGKADEHVAIEWQAAAAAVAGQWRTSLELSRQAVRVAVSGNMTGAAAGYATEQALRAAALGDCDRAMAGAAEGLKLERNRTTLPQAALALALCGKFGQGELLVEELTKRYPQDSLINSLWLPVVYAAMDLNKGKPANAIDRLQARRYESVAQLWPSYLRGKAYLSLGKGTEASGEFRDMLDNRGRAPLSVLYPLAQLGLARAATFQGDPLQSAQARQALEAIWASADARLPVLAQSRSEDRRN